jgi:hypothetical protein
MHKAGSSFVASQSSVDVNAFALGVDDAAATSSSSCNVSLFVLTDPGWGAGSLSATAVTAAALPLLAASVIVGVPTTFVALQTKLTVWAEAAPPATNESVTAATTCSPRNAAIIAAAPAYSVGAGGQVRIQVDIMDGSAVGVVAPLPRLLLLALNSTTRSALATVFAPVAITVNLAGLEYLQLEPIDRFTSMIPPYTALAARAVAAAIKSNALFLITDATAVAMASAGSRVTVIITLTNVVWDTFGVTAFSISRVHTVEVLCAQTTISGLAPFLVPVSSLLAEDAQLLSRDSAVWLIAAAVVKSVHAGFSTARLVATSAASSLNVNPRATNGGAPELTAAGAAAIASAQDRFGVAAAFSSGDDLVSHGNMGALVLCRAGSGSGAVETPNIALALENSWLVGIGSMTPFVNGTRGDATFACVYRDGALAMEAVNVSVDNAACLPSTTTMTNPGVNTTNASTAFGSTATNATSNATETTTVTATESSTTETAVTRGSTAMTTSAAPTTLVTTHPTTTTTTDATSPPIVSTTSAVAVTAAPPAPTDAPATPLPTVADSATPLVSPAIAQVQQDTSTTASVVSIVSSAVGASPGPAGAVARAGILASSARCSDSASNFAADENSTNSNHTTDGAGGANGFGAEPLAFFQNPTGAQIYVGDAGDGSGGDLSYHIGAAIANTGLTIGFGCLSLGLAVLRHWVLLDRSRKRRGWRAALGYARFPGIMAFPVLYFVEPTVYASVTLIAFGGGGSSGGAVVALGVITLLFWLACVVGLTVLPSLAFAAFAATYRPHDTAFQSGCGEEKCQAWLLWAIGERGEWFDVPLPLLTLPAAARIAAVATLKDSELRSGDCVVAVRGVAVTAATTGSGVHAHAPPTPGSTGDMSACLLSNDSQVTSLAEAKPAKLNAEEESEIETFLGQLSHQTAPCEQKLREPPTDGTVSSLADPFDDDKKGVRGVEGTEADTTSRSDVDARTAPIATYRSYGSVSWRGLGVDYIGACYWFPMADFGLSLSLGIIEGLAPFFPSCAVSGWIYCVLFGAYALAYGYFRPHNLRLDLAGAAVVAAVQFLAAFLAALDVADDAVMVMSTICLLFSTAQGALGTLLEFGAFARRKFCPEMLAWCDRRPLVDRDGRNREGAVQKTPTFDNLGDDDLIVAALLADPASGGSNTTTTTSITTCSKQPMRPQGDEAATILPFDVTLVADEPTRTTTSVAVPHESDTALDGRLIETDDDGVGGDYGATADPSTLVVDGDEAYDSPAQQQRRVRALLDELEAEEFVAAHAVTTRSPRVGDSTDLARAALENLRAHRLTSRVAERVSAQVDHMAGNVVAAPAVEVGPDDQHAYLLL